MIWSAPHTAEALSSRAFGSLMLATPSTQTVTNATQRKISTGLGSERLTEGTRVAATIPVKRAMESCSSSGASTLRRTRPRGRVLADGLGHASFKEGAHTGARRLVSIRRPMLCLDGADADPLGVRSAIFMGVLLII